MPKYFVRFANDHASASAELEAPSFESAFASAFELAAHQTGLHFETVYRIHPVDEIAVQTPASGIRPYPVPHSGNVRG